MAGHNKWSKIKHKKAASDAEKSKIFGKLARLITIESKKANGDTNSPGLRAVIEKAKASNMPKDNIERAVKKGVSADAASLEEVVYEVYGPGGSAVIISGLTDNKNRTAAEVKHLLSKNNLSLAEPGSALWAFKKEGGEYIPTSELPISDEDGEKLSKLMEDLEELEDTQEIYTNAS
ncbi:MAG: YebC/PmpR family DNA-binding transcriptional regulator [Candidatus Pacebacteria bacterium]|jgi:YebC/PmpR family DNA-binding regulatory protein|nr:YebC/PmpR family DNA-binding transcriptional regulator [bacterium]MDP6527972.1 YebC/PmpR family DNA-binding transcriptional regulator [Candidatus Paceibacterota bacterium]MDP6659769.1 YebC/PmpR family DNA-binding transcriptional regulator [Candidatus Paceibacterota bacterium]|tara:strand:- start:785 stop:1315 length:531 start_codon:yes stop_codon:yes gene_type:complete